MKILKFLSTFIGIVLLIALIGGIIYMSINGFPELPPIENPFAPNDTNNPSTPNDEQKPVEPSSPNIPDEPYSPTLPDDLTNKSVVAVDKLGNELFSDTPIAMQSFAYTCSENSTNKTLTLNAVVLPDNASDKTLEWSINWVNPSQGFAVGKNVNNYVTITPSADTLSCNVSYVTDFGSQIQVDAKSKSNPACSSSCFVDCMQKIDFSFTHFQVKPKLYNSTQYECNTIESYPASHKVYNNQIGINPSAIRPNQFYDYAETHEGYESSEYNNEYMKEYFDIALNYNKPYTVSGDFNPLDYSIEATYTMNPKLVEMFKQKNIPIISETLTQKLSGSILEYHKNIIEFTPYEYNSYSENEGYFIGAKPESLFNYNLYNPYELGFDMASLNYHVNLNLTIKSNNKIFATNDLEMTINPKMFYVAPNSITLNSNNVTF